MTHGAGHIPLLLAVETEATRFHGEHAVRPAMLGKGDAEQVLAHVSADLAALFPELAECSLVMPGALFDQTQLLQPGYPVYRSLENMLAESFTADGAQPRLLSLGADRDRMPSPELEPKADVPLGMLQILPLLVAGEPGLTRDLAMRMEHRFLESGQVSAHTAKGLEANFGIPVTHARFMTMTDLHAMLRMQLEHFGFLPLWELLYAALDLEPGSLAASGRGGQRFEWRDGAVHCLFETFDHWANDGPGREYSCAGQILAREYSDWTREYRQYLTTLQAHAVPVLQHLAEDPDPVLEGSFLVEVSALAPGNGAAQVTEHSSGELGTIAVTVIHAGRQLNYYPLIPAGLNELHAVLRDSGLGGGGVAFPGCINYSERERRLIPDALST